MSRLTAEDVMKRLSRVKLYAQQYMLEYRVTADCEVQCSECMTPARWYVAGVAGPKRRSEGAEYVADLACQALRSVLLSEQPDESEGRDIVYQPFVHRPEPQPPSP